MFLVCCLLLSLWLCGMFGVYFTGATCQSDTFTHLPPTSTTATSVTKEQQEFFIFLFNFVVCFMIWIFLFFLVRWFLSASVDSFWSSVRQFSPFEITVDSAIGDSSSKDVSFAWESSSSFTRVTLVWSQEEFSSSSSKRPVSGQSIMVGLSWWNTRWTPLEDQMSKEL